MLKINKAIVDFIPEVKVIRWKNSKKTYIRKKSMNKQSVFKNRQIYEFYIYIIKVYFICINLAVLDFTNLVWQLRGIIKIIVKKYSDL